jgi:CBS domain containing-hemolysin-like protein
MSHLAGTAAEAVFAAPSTPAVAMPALPKTAPFKSWRRLIAVLSFFCAAMVIFPFNKIGYKETTSQNSHIIFDQNAAWVAGVYGGCVECVKGNISFKVRRERQGGG